MARLPGVSSWRGTSSSLPASTFLASSAIRLRYSSYSIALCLRASMISSSRSDILE